MTKNEEYVSELEAIKSFIEGFAIATKNQSISDFCDVVHAKIDSVIKKIENVITPNCS